MCINCHVLIVLIVLVIAETLGLWFVNNKLNIPESRVYAVAFVYQFSILSFAIKIISSAFEALIIAYERMSFFSLVSIVDVTLNLAIVYLLVVSPIDKLISYSILLSCTSFISLSLNFLYCRHSFKDIKICFFWDKSLFKRIMSFSGLTIIGGGASIVAHQGSNILLNTFYNVAVNASFGIASKISSIINSFVANFQTAYKPQIVKMYADGKRDEQVKLILRASSASYYLLLLICVPLMLNIEAVITLWLGECPNHTTTLAIWMLVYCMIDAIQAPLWMFITATGNIRQYTIWLSALLLLNLPVSWLALKLGASPEVVSIIKATLNFITAIIRTIYVNRAFNFPSSKYVQMIIIHVIPVTVLSFVTGDIVTKYFGSETIISLGFNIILCVFLTATITFFCGFSKSDRNMILYFVKQKIKK